MLVLIAIGLIGFAADTRANGEAEQRAHEIFEKQIRPTLLEHCIRCHGAEKQKGGLRLDLAGGWAIGGDSGPALIPGDGQSLVLRAIRYDDANLEMPPKGKLPDKTIAAFEQWIALGALDPRSDSPADPQVTETPRGWKEGKSFWAFQPRSEINPPSVDQTEWPASDIDRFVLAGLEREGLAPNGMADRATLLRRIHYDLVGLPPTPEEIGEFTRDPSHRALEKVVDRLLNSPRFGQRWGRHWLDVVRFAESSGGGRTLLFPDAWRYRDYVIDSFNRDVPYDRFVREQIAGDLLPWSDWRERQRNLIATGFLLLGPTNYEMQDKDILEMDVVDEQLDTIGKAFLGMTVGCARCHDHKFDPIPATDYYAMAGIFKSTQSLIHSNVSSWNTVGLPLSESDESRLVAHESRVQSVKQQLQAATRQWKRAGGDPKQDRSGASIDPALVDAIVLDDVDAERKGAWTESTSNPRYVGARYIHDAADQKGRKSVTYQQSLDHEVEYDVLISYSAGSNRSSRVPVRVLHREGETVIHVDQRLKPPLYSAFFSLGRFVFDADHPPRVVISNEDTSDGVVIADAVLLVAHSKPLEEILRDRPNVKEVDQQEVLNLKARVDELQKQLDELEKSGPSRPVAIAVQDRSETGDIHVAIRGVVGQNGPLTQRGVIQVASWEAFPEIPGGCSGRQEFADWLSDSQHPLTARVMANRVWYWMMGEGLVRTVDNFGSTGEPPSNPALLDYLANVFVDDGWSIKRLVRRIALSRVYQLSSEPSSGSDLDRSNRHLWRSNRKRLRAEDIRDSILMVAGSLDDDFGGPTIQPGTKIEYGYQFNSLRRSVYLPVFRNTLPEVFEVFDFADPNMQRGQRSVSTIASQALWMMNHPSVGKQSKQAADRLLEMGLANDRSRIDYAFLQVLGRLPHPGERKIALDLVADSEHDGGSIGREKADDWAMLYQTLFQCVDFRYLN